MRSPVPYDARVPAGRAPVIDADLAAHLQGPVSALLATTDAMAVPDATRINGLVALDGHRLRVLIAADATTARANATPGARVAVLVTNMLSFRSIQMKGSVLIASPARTPGDLALVHHHVTTFIETSPAVGIDPALSRDFFAVEVVPLVVEVDALFDQSPGPGAGRRMEVGG
jgi:hypothetical protein